MNIEYIVVQAGGKGSRMDYLTANKPKCLVPVDNLPMLFHLFQKYPDKKFIIIGDYKFEVLREYLKAFAKVKYLLVDARGYKGTCAGMKQSVELLPADKAFMIIWSDLILPQEFQFPEKECNYVGLSGDFRCRWKYEKGIFAEEPSIEYGVAGLFVLENKNALSGVPEEGEFVKWLKDENITWDTLTLSRTKEYGLIEEYQKLEKKRCRPFNRMIVKNDKIIKEGIDEQGKALAIREKAWYRHVQELGVKGIPEIYSFDPFTMEKIEGKNIYEYELTKEKKEQILRALVENLKQLHGLETVESDFFSIKSAYLTKTLERLQKIRDMVPFADQKQIRINGKLCRNIYFYQELLEERVSRLRMKNFCLIHGDCTFSNMMLKNDSIPIMIDPRGYFGYTEIYGDPAYDWAKFYYSIKGNYDRFNLKEFRLEINDTSVTLNIKSNGWEDMEDIFFKLIEDETDCDTIRLLHAIIWLSLTTYAWEDYDSICGAFYNGLYYLEDIL